MEPEEQRLLDIEEKIKELERVVGAWNRMLSDVTISVNRTVDRMGKLEHAIRMFIHTFQEEK